ncbi:Protein of unknown function [Gryllus bimaculatus]|nr:Protein of unknown function [Gryllus bimaculatus]
MPCKCSTMNESISAVDRETPAARPVSTPKNRSLAPVATAEVGLPRALTPAALLRAKFKKSSSQNLLLPILEKGLNVDQGHTYKLETLTPTNNENDQNNCASYNEWHMTEILERVQLVLVRAKSVLGEPNQECCVELLLSGQLVPVKEDQNYSMTMKNTNY